MKKKFLITSFAVVAMAIGGVVFVHTALTHGDPIFEANVEALTNGEGGLSDPIWIVHPRPDGGFNCTRGGNKVC